MFDWDNTLNRVFLKKVKEIKFCRVKKRFIFAPQINEMSLNLHIRHHHFTHRVSCDVFM